MNKEDILKLIDIRKYQQNIAKKNNEYDVVQYHQKEIDKLYIKLKELNN